MKKVISIFLALTILLLSGCSAKSNSQENIITQSTTSINPVENESLQFSGLDDTDLLQYVNDTVYSNLEASFDSDDFQVYDVNSTYISKEYLEELSYNSKENIYFGYTLSELNKLFDNKPYIFTLGKDGKTTVCSHEEYDNSYEKTLLKNIAIGTGIILVCVTVSVATVGVGNGAISLVFAASAKTAEKFAASSALFSGFTSTIVTGIKTKDIDQAMKSGILKASEGFKWGAIAGALAGGAKEAIALNHAANIVPSAREAEILALQKYGGREQVPFLSGEEVSITTQGTTRPDIVREINGHLEAIEVKNYDLQNTNSVNYLYSELERQVQERISNLPKGSTQRIVLCVKGRHYPESLIESVIKNISGRLYSIYPNIPIDVI